MYMKVNPDGTAAGYVRNFPSLDHLQANEKLIATVTMEFSPSPGHPENYTKFFVFGPDGERLLAADLDGRGPKPVPGVCNVCHGGTPKATFTNKSGQVTYPDQGDTNAQFLPWDVDTFKFAKTPGLSRAEQEQDFYELNQLAKATWPVDPGAVTGARWTGATATELVNGWYEDGLVFKGEYVPPGWNNSPEERELYLEVVGPNCRACHITRGNAQQHAIDLASYDKFMGYAPLIRDLVYEQGVMPLASRTFGHFWSGGANSPAVKLAQALPAHYDLFPGTGESIKPGRPVVRYGVVTEGNPIPFKFPPDSRGVLHDGRSSLFSEGQDWRAISVNRVAETTENYGNQAISQSSPGDNSQFRVVRQIADPAAVRHTPFERNAAVGDITFFFDILPILQSQCVSCHRYDGPIPNIPVVFEYNEDSVDSVQIYKTVLDRINFEQPLQSLFLTKPGGFRHGFNGDKGAVLQSPVSGWDLFDDSDGSLLLHGQRGINAFTVANWISIGAPFWGNTSSGKSWTCQNVDLPVPDNDPIGLQDLVLAGPNQVIRELKIELDIDHENPNDLQVSLVNVNTGDEFLLLDRPSGLDPGICAEQEVVLDIWDLYDSTQTEFCVSGVSYIKPVEPLAPLDGRPLSDLWQLNVRDLSEGSTGVLNQWCIRNMVRCSVSGSGISCQQ
jgi:mono/diheme cytochrome c family protein